MSAGRALSRISRYADGRGNTVDYGYDGLDRLTSLVYRTAGGVEEARHEYAYDGDGNLIERRDVEGLTTGVYAFGYDDLGRLIREDRPGGEFTSYGYDRTGNLTSLDVPDGGLPAVGYGYDAINRLSSVQEPGQSTIIDVDHHDTSGDSDPDTPEHGNKRVSTLPNGVITTEVFDAAGRLLRTQSTNGGALLQRFVYEYQRTSGSATRQVALRSKETDENANVTSYGYDSALDRLLEAQTTDSGGSVIKAYAYQLDAAGNLTRRSEDTGAPTHYAYNQANQLCWSQTANLGSVPGCDQPPSGADRYGYDAHGNQATQTTSAGTQTFSWNARNQLISLTDTAGNSPSAREYAGPGHEQRTTAGSTSTVNDALGLASATDSATVYYTRGEQGQLLAQRTPAASSPDRVHYPLTDALGSVRALTDQTGTVTRRYDYDPYGRQSASTGSGPTIRLRYAGGELDDRGQIHFGARYYNPAIGRWTQPDPLNQPADLRQANRYAYVGADPINWRDPAGTSFLKDMAGGVIVAASVVGAIGLTAGCVAATRGLHTFHCAHAGLGIGTAGVMLGTALITDDD